MFLCFSSLLNIPAVVLFIFSTWTVGVKQFRCTCTVTIKKDSIPDPANTQVETDVYIVVSSLWMVNAYGFNFFPLTQNSYSLGLLEREKNYHVIWPGPQFVSICLPPALWVSGGTAECKWKAAKWRPSHVESARRHPGPGTFVQPLFFSNTCISCCLNKVSGSILLMIYSFDWSIHLGEWVIHIILLFKVIWACNNKLFWFHLN